jgi:hypothetical protein
LTVAALEDAVPELLHAVDDADDPAVLALVGVLTGTALLRDLGRRVPLADPGLVERGELTAQRAAAGKEREHEVDDEHGQPEAAAAHGEPAGPAHAPPADVSDLARVEPGTPSKPHGSSSTR